MRSLGPVSYNDLSLGLEASFYEASYLDPSFKVNSDEIFSIPGILSSDISFDVQGNIFVTYETASGVYIYWYDPSLAVFTHTLISPGALNPWCCIDTTNFVLVEYASNIVCCELGGRVVVYNSSNRFTSYYDTGIVLGSQKILSAGMDDYKFRYNIGIG